jgi:DNA polymerase-3 subunit beta
MDGGVMIAIIEKQDLLGLLARTQNIVEKRNTMPVLVNVLLQANKNGLRVYATDLEVSLTDEIPAQVRSEGRCAANAKSLFEIVKELQDGPVAVERLPNDWLRITQNKSEFTIVGISPDEYPVFPSYTTKKFMSIQAAVLREMIEKTIYSVSNDETRYHLNGVYFENTMQGDKSFYRMVATDGHRLSVVDRESSEVGEASGKGVIIPRKGLYEIRKLLESIHGDFEMAIEGAQLIVRHGKTLLMIRLIEGKYPNYQQLIPQNLSQKLSVKRDQLLASLKRVSLMSNQKSKGVTLHLKPGRLEITSNNPETGQAKEELEINYGGSDLRIGFNAKYILDVLSSMENDKVSFELNDQLSPGLMRPEGDENYRCVVMPMRI